MSTAGKVLTVLVLLVMIGWIIMLSAVTQLNVNWEQRIAKQEDDLQKATERADAAKLLTKPICAFLSTAKVWPRRCCSYPVHREP